MTKLLGRLLNQKISFIHCWWSWGQFAEEKNKWIGAVGKVCKKNKVEIELLKSKISGIV